MSLRRRVDEMRLAFMLLSRLPIGRMETAPPLGACVWAYPVAGAVMGALAGLAFQLAAWAELPPLVAGLAAMGASMLLTGAMHEDGLADMADGFGGGQGKARKLEIMRDSRIGSYGVVVLVLVLGARAACLAALPAPGMVLRLAVVGAVSRAFLPVLMLALPPARVDGLGQAAGVHVRAGPVTMGVVLAGLMAMGLGHSRLLAIMAGVTLAVGWLAKRQIGGFTGDVLGGAQSLCEVAGLCVLAAHGPSRLI
ncbi:adenosylcobinamide-GDP ribazoletransferase [Acidocella aminolytica]|jgi:adenosylcobinamide-GDP ribazoletransferase|uniref:Adenosylcobinamide-GDP ribazoletransferase n=1 Tax=Acidocella aminolytica 101 = DSM 11237 TaxID=1120923 RepID=A0A0D6PEK9_9PROT|nr:adenosylcobinamide-GDP ribazoletransferase [Acidocella aminolytica]GAN79633.1 cobalamin (5'-phosphate) synthase [Acidocella aminolytica 101 = DSM 11237]GBQ34066.1 cobalamin-5-phosphate synthase [Acidocella aminolytica 101 = DSM 11237]SHF05873.1 cobalamin-5'-phosphate synthase [Acidocella aminolytica 101 = DSM 11237]